MAFPTIQTADTQHNHVTGNSNSWTLVYPTNLASGDLIIAVVATDGGTVTGTWPLNWQVGGQDGNGACSLLFAKKKSDGTETGNFTLGLSASEQGSWAVYRITGWEGTIGSGFANAAPTGAAVAASIGGASLNPDPPSLNPANWDVEDTLWFAVCAVDTSRTISVYPYADNNYSDPSGGSTGATLGVCTTNSAVASLDPGTFTISNSDDWAAATIGVRPLAAVPRVLPLPQPSNFQNPAIF